MPFRHAAWIWLNGRLLPTADATTHVAAHALHYGTGVFEGLRYYPSAAGPTAFRLGAHLDRLFASAEIYALAIPYSREELAAAIAEVVRGNGFDHCYVRPICFAGAETLGMRAESPVEVAVLAWPNLQHATEESRRRGLRVTISPWVKFHSSMMPTAAKACGQYLNSRLAALDARRRGFEEALLLNTAGDLAEAAVANLFLVRDGELFTNDVSASILPGITQDSVARIARDLGYRVTIGRLRPADLTAADEAFLTGTAAEIVPIREVDGEPVGRGEPGPVAIRLQRAFSAIVRGEDDRYSAWLTPLAAPRPAEPMLRS